MTTTENSLERKVRSIGYLLREGPLRPRRFSFPVWGSIDDVPSNPRNGEIGIRIDLKQVWIYLEPGGWYKGETMTVVE